MAETELAELSDGVWIASDPVSIVGMPLTTTMTVLRLDDGSILVYSPVSLTPERRTAVNRIGRVAHIYAPNLFHHLHVGPWVEAFPDACVHGPKGLEKKRADLRIDRAHGTEVFSDTVEELRIEGFRLRETALFHRPSGVLAVADLAQNVGRPEGTWTKAYTRAMGFYDQVALSRMLRWTAFSDKDSARASLDRLLALPIQSIVVGHGAPITDGALEALRAAYTWLPTKVG